MFFTSKKNTLLLLVSCMLLGSCNSDLNDSIAVGTSTQGISSAALSHHTLVVPGLDWHSLVLSNPDNPLESYGEFHNQAMDYFFDHGLFLDNPWSDQYTEVVDSLISYAEEAMPHLAGSLSNADPQMLDITYIDEDTDLPLLPAGSFSADASSMFGLLSTLVTSSPDYSQRDSVIARSSQLVNLESQILSSTIAQGEKDLLLLISAVSRYSNAYWATQFLENPEFVYTLNQTLSSRSSSSMPVLDDDLKKFAGEFGGNDVSGACKGAVTGFLGTGGNPGGIVGGGIVGGFVGSWGYAARYFWNKLTD